MKILKTIKKLLKEKPKVPNCFEDENFLYCWCGKCKPKDFELPSDFKRLLAITTAKDFKDKHLTP